MTNEIDIIDDMDRMDKKDKDFSWSDGRIFESSKSILESTAPDHFGRYKQSFIDTIDIMDGIDEIRG